MTEKEFYAINWHRGNVAKLENGKEYLVKGTASHGKYLILYSEEYDSMFIADHRIVVSRTSDYAEPIEVYLEHKRQKQAAAEALREAERKERQRIKAELKEKHLREQEEIHQQALARKAAAKLQRQQEQQKSKPKDKSVKQTDVVNEPLTQDTTTPKVTQKEEPATEAPKKRVRQRIRILQTVTEKVSFKKK